MTSLSTAVAGTAARADRATVLRWTRDNGVYVALVLIVVYNVLFTPRFITWDNLDVQLVLCTRIVVVALGMAMVIGTAGIDLSVGAVMALSGALLVQFSGVPGVGAIALALVIGGLVGVLNGFLVGVVGIQPIVATLAFLFAGRSLAQLLLAGKNPSIHDKVILGISSGHVLGVNGLIIAALVAVGLVAFTVRRTNFGRQLLAVGDNARASYLSGVPVRRTLIGVYVLSGVLAAWAGVMDTASITSANALSSGLNYELFAITAVVVGGTPLTGGRVRVVGTVAAAILMQLLRSTLIFHSATDAVSQMVTAVVIVGAVYIQRVRARA
ncbi:ABC transporter permease [Cellulomonas sp. 73-145]|uniref:ABC transporter permease n=1 Tax=Cellulomonas sp. 73-145 TaxID=1895739 RepID=UPI000A5C85E8|nr:ABC transporter permease [Cellulomonas sp. 73-145]MBN9328569.1 ABC transporter permease [Cellulomonas sp.]